MLRSNETPSPVGAIATVLVWLLGIVFCIGAVRRQIKWRAQAAKKASEAAQ